MTDSPRYFIALILFVAILCVLAVIVNEIFVRKQIVAMGSEGVRLIMTTLYGQGGR